MADSYHIIDGKVVPYSGGRKCNDTDAWRDATPLELQLQEQLAEYEHATAAKDAEIDALRTRLEDTVRDSTNKIEALRAEVSGLRAARIAYANEFPATEDGDPDTGNIHANIRALKARADRLTEALRELVDLKDNVKHSFPNDYAVRKPLAWDKARALLRELEEGKCWT